MVSMASVAIKGGTLKRVTITPLNHPKGDIRDPNAKIWPFKVHLAVQPYDAGHNYLMQPVTAGQGGFWREFDWDQALRLGSASSNA